jgi:FtsZ-interacting cell division protein ZipA
MDQKVIWIVIAVAVIAVCVAAYFALRRRQSERLKDRFGPEYDRTVRAAGDPRRAEAELADREKRVSRIRIVPLSPEQRTRFLERWLATQKRFVDSPREAVADADRLVTELMTARGYPMTEFEQRAADVSVHHPRVVSSYRSARQIAERSARGQASTEDLRQAVVYYRELFEELLETEKPERAGVRR